MTDKSTDFRNIGLAKQRGREAHFAIRKGDRLLHVLLLGQTGTGKSSLLRRMIEQDILDNQGFCLIDPHGDLYRSVKRSGCRELLLWDLSDPSCGVGFNPLTVTSHAHRPLIVSGLIAAFKKQWEDAWGPRMEHLLRYALLALVERNDATLKDIIPLFIDKEKRSGIISQIQDSQVRYFWEIEYPAMNYRSTVDGVAPIANKIGAFLSHPTVREAICHPREAVDFSELINSGKSIAINLAKGGIGADASNVLGGLIVSSMAVASYQRQEVTQGDRNPYFLFIDEFQSFTTSFFGEMVSELRKYGIGLALSTQHTGQISGPVRDAVFGNVGTILAFRLGAADAEIVARQFGDGIPSQNDLVSLSNFEMYVRTLVNGVQTRPFSARTLTPLEGDIRL